MRKTGMSARRGGALLAVALIVGVAPVPAFATATACSCVSTEDSERERADVIFKGTLDGSTSSASTDRNGNVEESGLVHQFTPTTVYRGRVAIPQYVLEPPNGDPACAADLDGPGPYLVFAEKPSLKEKKKYQLNDADLLLRPCSGTQALNADDEPDFGPGRPATPPAPQPAEPPAEQPAEPSGGSESPEDTDDGGLSADNLLGDLLGGLLESLGLASDDPPDN